MFGLGRSVTLALVGWLWADILLGLFVIFLAAASPPVPAARSGPSIDPKPLQLTVNVDGARLLSGDDAEIKTAQSLFATSVEGQLKANNEARSVALLIAYGSQSDPALGQKIAQLTTDALAQGGLQVQFSRAVMKPLHDIVPGDPGTSVALELYFYR